MLGGIVDVETKTQITLYDAVERGWVDPRKAERLADFSRHSRQITNPVTNMNATYAELLQNTLIDEKTGVCVLNAYPRKQRNLKLESGLNVLAASLPSSRASSRGASPTRRTFEMGTF